MERGKNPQSNTKTKTQHFPADLFALGTKSSGNDTNKRTLGSGSSESKREAAPQNIPILAKKAKVGSPTLLGWPSTSASPAASTTVSESWEAVAVDLEPSEIVHSVLDAYQAGQLEKAAGFICGAIRTLKNTKWKPDLVIVVALIYLAKERSTT